MSKLKCGSARYLLVLVTATGLLISGCGGSPKTGMTPATGNASGKSSSGGGNDDRFIPRVEPLREALSGKIEDWRALNALSTPPLDAAGLAELNRVASPVNREPVGTDVLVLDRTASWEPPYPGSYRFARDGSSDAFTPLGERDRVHLGWHSSRATSSTFTTSLDLHWGGWLGRSRFGVVMNDSLHEEHGVRFKRLFAFTHGAASTGIQEGGSKRYRGIAVARELDGLVSPRSLVVYPLQNPSGFLLGKAEIHADFSRGLVHVRIGGFSDLDSGTTRTDLDVEWTGIKQNNDRFLSTEEGKRLKGFFYGDNGEEIGGVFRTTKIVGAFGSRGGIGGRMNGSDDNPDSVSSVSNPR